MGIPSSENCLWMAAFNRFISCISPCTNTCTNDILMINFNNKILLLIDHNTIPTYNPLRYSLTRWDGLNALTNTLVCSKSVWAEKEMYPTCNLHLVKEYRDSFQYPKILTCSLIGSFSPFSAVISSGSARMCWNNYYLIIARIPDNHLYTSTYSRNEISFPSNRKHTKKNEP